MSSRTPRRTPSPRQARVLEFICEQLDTFDRSPTIREIAEHIDVTSTNGVNDHLTALVKKGYVDTGADGESRSVRPLRYPDGSPFLTRAELLDELAAARQEADDLRDQLADAHAATAHIAAVNDANVCTYERIVHELETERRDTAEALGQCRAHCTEYYREARTLRGQVATLQGELGVGRLTLPRAVVEAIQAGDVGPVLQSLGLGDCREVA